MKTRPVLTAAGLLLVAGYGWTAVQLYHGRRAPEEPRAERGPWILGPPADRLAEASAERVQRALAALNDASRPPAERLRDYREELGASERLLVRSLRAQPAQALALAQLVAAKWELDPPRVQAAFDVHLRTLDLASRMAPGRADVQRMLGELLLSMGRREDSKRYLAAALDLDPALGPDVVELLRRNLATTDEVLEAFPQRASVLAALGPAAFEDGAQARYLDAMDAALAALAPEIPAELLSAYGSACLRMSKAAHMQERLTQVEGLASEHAEAERLWQRARAFQALGDMTAAVRDARDAAARRPESWRFAERKGRMLLAASQIDPAIEAFREAIALAARGPGGPALRARLYRRIGQAEEARGDPVGAYDAFKMALRLNPGEPYAKRRVHEMEAAAGKR